MFFPLGNINVAVIWYFPIILRLLVPIYYNFGESDVFIDISYLQWSGSQQEYLLEQEFFLARHKQHPRLSKWVKGTPSWFYFQFPFEIGTHTESSNYSHKWYFENLRQFVVVGFNSIEKIKKKTITGNMKMFCFLSMTTKYKEFRKFTWEVRILLS